MRFKTFEWSGHAPRRLRLMMAFVALGLMMLLGRLYAGSLPYIGVIGLLLGIAWLVAGLTARYTPGAPRPLVIEPDGKLKVLKDVRGSETGGRRGRKRDPGKRPGAR